MSTPAIPAVPAAGTAPATPATPTPSPAATPTPAAPAVATPSSDSGSQPPAAPAPPASPAGESTAPPAKYDPKTAVAPPDAKSYANNREGQMQFMADNTAWGLEHPEAAAQLRKQRAAAEDAPQGTEPLGDNATEQAVAQQEPTTEEPAKPATETQTVEAVTPAAIEQWSEKSPELKAAFEKNPELRAEMMEMARGYESAKPILEIVSTPEEAKFAVEHSNQLITLQANVMLAGEDPEMMGQAWNMVEEMFIERDAEGKPLVGADGKPIMGADYAPFKNHAASVRLNELTGSAETKIQQLQQKLQGVYPSEQAKEADQDALRDAQYEKAAYDFVMSQLKGGEAADSGLPKLPPNATPEQIEFQKKLEAQQKELDAKTGKQSVETRKASRAQLDKAVQNHYESTINAGIESYVNAMKERGEYIPEFVLTDKWVNPATGKTTNISAFGMKIYQAVDQKIASNPLHSAKLYQLQALGAAGKAAREAELTRLVNLYQPNIIKAEVKRIQDDIRKGAGAQSATPAVARVEPQMAGSAMPIGGMSREQAREWAIGEASKDPAWKGMNERSRETLVMQLAAKKRFGG